MMYKEGLKLTDACKEYKLFKLNRGEEFIDIMVDIDVFNLKWSEIKYLLECFYCSNLLLIKRVLVIINLERYDLSATEIVDMSLNVRELCNNIRKNVNKYCGDSESFNKKITGITIRFRIDREFIKAKVLSEGKEGLNEKNYLKQIDIDDSSRFRNIS